MPCRKSHSNSHHGCIQCKSKRVKCDQNQPRCARCQKKGQVCTYTHLTSSYDPFGNYNQGRLSCAPSNFVSTPLQQGAVAPSLGSEASLPRQFPSATPWSDSNSPPIQVSTLPLFTVTPLYKGLLAFDPVTEQLLHHYSTEVSLVFTSSEVQVEVLSCFHDAVIRHSFVYPYVYHAMLTVSALHLASHTPALGSTSQPRSPHLVMALAHKALALETLRSIVNSITASTCEPALAASGLLTVCAFALLPTGLVSDAIDLLGQIMTLYRGTVAIFDFGQKNSSTASNATVSRVRKFILTAIVVEKPWPKAEAAVDKVLLKISELCEASEGARRKKDALLDAGFKLKIALRRVAGARGVYNVACMWLAMVDPLFNESVKAREPLSLILLAHWVVALKYVKHIWWALGWPEWILQAVWQEVGEEHPDLLGWAFQEIRGEAQDENAESYVGKYQLLRGGRLTNTCPTTFRSTARKLYQIGNPNNQFDLNAAPASIDSYWVYTIASKETDGGYNFSNIQYGGLPTGSPRFTTSVEITSRYEYIIANRSEDRPTVR
ncbi:hypothetical protein F5Y05DRAFT_58357 [Hypoxylon sp. FL0543]|nr:hypothetical protein F5Y05DRAFT_58357 [Hypoxylon sp. FL0543]